ncbi:hypothetical protein IFM89_003805 [Coptis chinensis]|uniref:AT-hook motif nuclear-localized protein n=1 Tax=Coptis chinensis TaxID=261450 RepID=A0A835LD89_9MAGN|nr:hypothetical protein IFM89_003805 [Coptis chinensis]
MVLQGEIWNQLGGEFFTETVMVKHSVFILEEAWESKHAFVAVSSYCSLHRQGSTYEMDKVMDRVGLCGCCEGFSSGSRPLEVKMATELSDEEVVLLENIAPNSPPVLLSRSTVEQAEVVPQDQQLPKEAGKLEKVLTSSRDESFEKTKSPTNQHQHSNRVSDGSVKACKPPLSSGKRGRPPTLVQDRMVVLALSAKATQAQFLRTRGRRLGSTKKQYATAASSNTSSHVITIEPGEEVLSKVVEYLHHHCSRKAYIVSGTGAVSIATFFDSTTGGTTTYEGYFHIISLRGSFLLHESGELRKTSGLNITLAGLDDRSFSGCVSGDLIAASPVQVSLSCYSHEEQINTTSHLEPSSSPKTIGLDSKVVGTEIALLLGATIVEQASGTRHHQT